MKEVISQLNIGHNERVCEYKSDKARGSGKESLYMRTGIGLSGIAPEIDIWLWSIIKK